jgi:hypothetical protein
MTSTGWTVFKVGLRKREAKQWIAANSILAKPLTFAIMPRDVRKIQIDWSGQ